MKNRNRKIQLNKITTIVLVIAFAVVGTYLLTSSEAATANATFALTPNSGSYDIGEEFTIQLYENSGSQAVNTVEPKITYDTAKLEFISRTNVGGAFDTCFDTNEGAGVVSFSCTIIGSSKTSNQKVANLTFKAKVGTGSSALQFRNDSGIFEGNNENIWNGSPTAATYSFTTPDTTPPSVTITTPSNGSQAIGPVTIKANAQDNSGQISKVEFYVNNQKVNTDTSSPYEYTWDSTSLSDRTGLPIEVKAYDNATPQPNVGSASITVEIKNNKPNLIVSSLSINPTDPKAGDQVTLTAQVKNTGTADVLTSTGISNLFKLNSTNINSPISFSGLNINATKPFSTTWTATRGSYTIYAIADQNNAIAESNESDNQISKTVTVYKQADANNDNSVSGADLSILSTNWGKTGVQFSQGDFSGDGKVSGLDLSILSTNWGK